MYSIEHFLCTILCVLCILGCINHTAIATVFKINQRLRSYYLQLIHIYRTFIAQWRILRVARRMWSVSILVAHSTSEGENRLWAPDIFEIYLFFYLLIISSPDSPGLECDHLFLHTASPYSIMNNDQKFFYCIDFALDYEKPLSVAPLSKYLYKKFFFFDISCMKLALSLKY